MFALISGLPEQVRFKKIFHCLIVQLLRKTIGNPIYITKPTRTSIKIAKTRDFFLYAAAYGYSLRLAYFSPFMSNKFVHAVIIAIEAGK